MSNTDIQALLNGTAAIQTKIEILPQVAGESSITLTESNGIVSWDYEDFRFIKDQGFIGQFIAKQVTGTIKNPSDTFSMTDREFKLQMGVKVGNTLTWYSLGNFLVTKVTDDEVKDTTSFEALDYAKKFNKRYEDTITYPCTMLELVQNICNQCGCELGSTNFKHKDWVIDGNYFQNNESCRDVMKNLGKLAYSWVRVDWDNKVYFDFTKKTTVDSYNKITNHEYYSLTTQKEKKIVNRVVIGYSNIDGEQTKVEDTASIEANGLCEITIFDNPLVYNQALREKAIVGASDLLGLEYTPLEMQTVGHPWLKGYELIEATDMEGKVYKTIPFNRTIQYFGHIKSLIKIETETKTNTEYAYESGLKNDFLNAQIQVNKKLGIITSTVDEMNTKVEDITTTTQTSTGGNSLYLKEALESNALEYSVDGRCEQSTSTQGKNYYTGNKLTNGTNHGITYTFDNSILKLNGTSSDSGSIVSDVNTKINIPAGTYAYSMRKKSGSFTQNNKDLAIYLRSATGFITGDGTSSGLTLNSISSSGSVKKIITVSKDTELYIRIFVNGSGLVCDNLELEIQIEPGSSMTDFEQFVPNSPSPDYPSEIKTVKGIRNLFDGVLFNGYLNNGLVADSNWKTTDYIEVKSNTKYITSYLKNTTRVLYEEYTSKDVSSRVSARKETTPKTAITTQNTTKYIRFSFNDNSLTDKEIMLEPGSVAHSYVPYGTYEKIKVTGKNLIKNTNVATNGSNYWASYSTFDESTRTLTRSTSATTESFIWYFIDGMKSNTTYTVSCLAKSNGYVKSMDMFMYATGAKGTKSKNNIPLTTNFEKYTFTFTTDENIDYSRKSYIRFDNNGSTTSGTVATLTIKDVMLCEGTNDDYEPYKEKEVLIDLAKENLFDKDNVSFGYVDNTTGVLKQNGISSHSITNDTISFIATANYRGIVSDYISVDSLTNYVLNCVSDYSSMFYIVYNYDNEFNFLGYSTGKPSVPYSFTTLKNTQYIRSVIEVSTYKADTTVNVSNIKIYKGTNADDSYELNSIGDIKDKLEIINGVAVIQKRIGKVVLDGTETGWGKSGATGNVSYYYSAVYGTSGYKFNDIDLTNVGTTSSTTPVPAYCDYFQSIAGNKIFTDIKGLIFDYISNTKTIELRLGFGLDTTITTVDLLKAWLKANPVTVYYILNEPETITLPNTNIPLYEGINHVTLVEDLETTTSIKYLRKTPISGEYALNQDLNKTNSNLADTNNQLSQAQSDIDNTKTNLNNNYYNKEQVDSINSTTTQNITQIRNTMEQNITSTNASISKIQEEITNGVSKVTTTTGTFDENGLNISKSGQPMSSTLDWDGLEVVRDKGKATETEVLTVRSAGVEAENMTVRNFFIEKPIRIEKCKSITDSTKVGLGFFWIGE